MPSDHPNSKNPFPTNIKVTARAFWWGALQKFPHLIATRKAFWLGTFSKIQSMFTNIPLT